MVLDAPRRAGILWQALVADNLDVGRPGRVELIFTGHKGRRGRLPKVEQVFKTKVVTRDTLVTVDAFYKPSRVRQYLKDGRAHRIETVRQLTDRPALPAPPAAPRRTGGQRP